MLTNTEILTGIRCIIKLYEKESEPLRKQYDLSQIEIDILAFLNNHQDKNTASDIVELRRIPKANVSQAVEALIQKEFLLREHDKQDRRRIHLQLTDRAYKLIPMIFEYRKRVREKLFDGISDEEREIYARINRQIAANAANELGR